jgi:hypothetical protein
MLLKLFDVVLHNLYYSSADIIMVIKLKIMKSSAHVAYIGEMKSVYINLVGNLEGKSPL